MPKRNGLSGKWYGLDRARSCSSSLLLVLLVHCFYAIGSYCSAQSIHIAAYSRVAWAQARVGLNQRAHWLAAATAAAIMTHCAAALALVGGRHSTLRPATHNAASRADRSAPDRSALAIEPDAHNG